MDILFHLNGTTMRRLTYTMQHEVVYVMRLSVGVWWSPNSQPGHNEVKCTLSVRDQKADGK